MDQILPHYLIRQYIYFPGHMMRIPAVFFPKLAVCNLREWLVVALPWLLHGGQANRQFEMFTTIDGFQAMKPTIVDYSISVNILQQPEVLMQSILKRSLIQNRYRCIPDQLHHIAYFACFFVFAIIAGLIISLADAWQWT